MENRLRSSNCLCCRKRPHPTAAWTAQQIVEAFPEATAPKYVMRDRDRIYGTTFRDRLTGMGIEEVLSAPRSPWQNAFVERLIGSVRRECLDHIVLGERHLRRLLASYFDYYHRSRTHLSLNKDAPAYRPVMSPEIGEVAACQRSAACTTGTTAAPPDLAPGAPAFVGRSDKQPAASTCPPRPAHLFSAVQRRPGLRRSRRG
jgi:hypothetical protein